MTTLYSQVYEMVGRIPPGRVVTYGEVARLIGRPRAARQVGYALAALEQGTAIPWQRVVNARGEISPRAAGGSDDLQRILLEEEGVEFDQEGRIDLERFGWSVADEPARTG